MNIQVDYRESKLIDVLNKLVNDNNIGKEDINQHVTLTQANLDVGDVKLFFNEILLIILERKTISDLASSIIDGRYKEQSFRLNEHTLHNHNIIYLIEGNIDSYKGYGNISSSSIYSSIVTLQYFKGFSVYNSKDINQTGMYIYKFAEKILKSKNPKGFFNANSHKFDNLQYSDVKQNITKKSEITPSNIGEIMLMQIPSVSPNIAKTIMSKCNGCIVDLIAELQENKDFLDETFIASPDPNPKSRRISKKSIEQIKTFLL